MQPSASNDTKPTLWAGAATVDLTPQSSVFLYGYPHVPRMSTGVHDRLEAAALFLRSGSDSVLFVANDLIFVGNGLANEARSRISLRTGIPVEAIAITATHTHSGPVMVDYVSNSCDPVVPKVDPKYLNWVLEGIVEAGCAAMRMAVPSEIGLAVACAEGVGTNRHNPSGPVDSEVPVLVARSLATGRPLACMIAYAMHPTVLHEDSTLISGDFPHFTRQYLKAKGLVPDNCPILYHNGASGNQSPRHVTKGNTFVEARRLGELLGTAIARVIPQIIYSPGLSVSARSMQVELLARDLPSVTRAEVQAREAWAHYEVLRTAQAARSAVRTAECDWFGAEETVALARAAADGRLTAAVRGCAPAKIQVIRLGPWNFVLWPGEFFVEYALQVKARSANTFVVTMANGELQGYIVTPEAAARGVYEATNALFSPDCGRRIAEATLTMLSKQG